MFFFILSVSCCSEFGFVSERLYSFSSMPGDIVDVIATTAFMPIDAIILAAFQSSISVLVVVISAIRYPQCYPKP